MRLVAQGLACHYGPVRALDGLDVDASGGSILAVFGPNGAGKTTLLRVLSGERKPDSGTVRLDDSEVSGADPVWRARVGVVSHRTGLYNKLTVEENLTFFSSLHGVVGESRATADRAVELLDEVGAADLLGVLVGRLSRGQRQRVALARSLAHDPDLLFLDEPFAGLDPRSAETLDAMLTNRRATGTIAVLVTHDVRRGLALADRVLVLRRGRKVLDASADDHEPEDLLAYFTAGGKRLPGPEPLAT